MNRIKDALDNMGINYDIKGDFALIEFWTDTAEQDIPVEFDYDGTPENFVEKFSHYAENYDVDDEVERLVDMRGKNGVPESVRTLLDDCQEAKDTLMEIAENLKNALLGEEYETYTVNITVTATYTKTVKAKSGDEAKEKGEYEFSEADFGEAEDIDGFVHTIEDECGNIVYEVG